MKFLELVSGVLIAESAVVRIGPAGDKPLSGDLHLYRYVEYRVGDEIADDFCSPEALAEFLK